MKKLCMICNELLQSEEDVVEHAKRHAHEFYDPRFHSSLDDALIRAYLSIYLLSRDA